jgi:hypothetical protein
MKLIEQLNTMVSRSKEYYMKVNNLNDILNLIYMSNVNQRAIPYNCHVLYHLIQICDHVLGSFHLA